MVAKVADAPVKMGTRDVVGEGAGALAYDFTPCPGTGDLLYVIRPHSFRIVFFCEVHLGVPGVDERNFASLAEFRRDRPLLLSSPGLCSYAIRVSAAAV